MADQVTGPIDTPDAFRELFEATYPELVAYARRRVPAHRADDVVSEVYVTAWRRRDDLRPGTPARPWLYGIAGNVVRNLRRSEHRQLRLVEKIETQPASPTPHHDPVDAVLDGDGARLRAGLERLSFDDQEVLRLVAWEGLSHAEAALALHCSTNAVGIRIHRARKRLEIELERLDNPVIPHPTSAGPAGEEPEEGSLT